MQLLINGIQNRSCHYRVTLYLSCKNVNLQNNCILQ